MDPMVAASQGWLNNEYTGVSGWNPVDEDGETGWQTVNAIIRALQHELGITTLVDNFGPSTLSNLTSQIGSVTSSTSNTNVIALMQCGMWCKGYHGGYSFGDWVTSPELNDSLPSMRNNMGLGYVTALPPKGFKSLLTMDSYTTRPGGSSSTASTQRWLNGTYYTRADYFIMPCDGYYSRDVQRGLMFAIQYELGMADGVANGNFGPGTQSGLQTHGNFGLGATDSTRRLVRLFKAALIFNGYDVPFSGTFDSTTVSQTSAFQAFSALPVTGAANFQTWAALLVSTGDPNRPVSAADASTPLTAATASTLASGGYMTVGRYLFGSSKRIQPNELSALFGAGLKLFPIMQESNDTLGYFSNAQGLRQGEMAAKRARQLGLASGTTIYFAVDVDVTNDDITTHILPYFAGVKQAVAYSRTPSYQVGVYGTRNVCSRVAAAGHATSSFVAGMSTGWSGNLGFPLPANWAYDQIKNTWIGSGAGSIEIDRNAKAPGAPEVTSAQVARTPRVVSGGVSAYDELGWWKWAGLTMLAERADSHNMSARSRAQLVLNQLRKPEYYLMPGENPVENPTKLAWTYVAADPPPAFTGNSAQLIWEPAKEIFEDLYNDPEYVIPFDGPIGDTPHFAATALTYLQWGTWPTPWVPLWIAEYGGWVLDLASAWDDYEKARIQNGGSLDVRTWFKDSIGATAEQFGKKDLQADMAAHICVGLLNSNPAMTLDNALRQMYNAIEDDPGYLATTFIADRFGSRNAIVEAAMAVFTTSWPGALPVEHVVESERNPGGVSPGTPAVPDPSAGVRATELEALANGFADALERAATEWTN